MNIILSHDHTDFDAVASQLGAWKLYPDYVPIAGRFLNRNVRNFLTLYWGALPFIYAEDMPPDRQTGCPLGIERAILVDTQRMPALKGFNTERIPEVRVIDHHELREDLPEQWTVQLDQTGSCATIFVEAIAAQQLPLSWVEATLLLLGIHEDTGSLVYNSSTARDGRAAAWLMEQGADLDILRQFLEAPLSELQGELYQKLLEAPLFLDVGAFQVMIAHAKMDQDVDGEPLESVLSRLKALLPEGIHLKRDKVVPTGHDITTSVVPSRRGETPEVVTTTLSRRERGTVSDWMSRGKIRSFAPSTRIKEAAALMQRWGHEGFPVVDEQGEVVGLLTRRDADRALHHKFGNAPITEFMHKGNIVVTPKEAISQVQRLMTQANIGQIPVVASQTRQLIGIITRTDLLRYLRDVSEVGRMGLIRSDAEGNDALPPDAKALINNLVASLSPATFALVRYIAHLASQMSYRAYLVGGIVRDLLLKRPMKDLDIVIEGDAIPLAKELTKRLGGRIIAHKRFGTAKWILNPKIASSPHLRPFLSSVEAAPCAKDDGTSRGNPCGCPSRGNPCGCPRSDGTSGCPRSEAWFPEHIDLITARTEFYERPTALPQVEHASIKLDLHRRDFTINTLALSLEPQNEENGTPPLEGHLLDFYGGKADLEQGIIRVLHNLSFVEDPTRILRAIRFEQRFDFTLEPRTAELLHASVALLHQVSPDRLRHELFLSLQEKTPERILKRLDELNIMSILLPGVGWHERHAARFERLRVHIDIQTKISVRSNDFSRSAPRTTEVVTTEHFLTALLWEAKRAEIDQIAKRIGLSGEWHKRLQSLLEVRGQEEALLVPELANSQLHQQLHKHDPLALDLLATLTEHEALRQRLRFYLNDLRQRTISISGHDLRALGLPPGRLYKTILNTIHAAMLDGEATDEAAQREMLAREVDNNRDVRGSEAVSE